MTEQVRNQEISTADLAAASKARQDQPGHTTEFASSLAPTQTAAGDRPIALLSSGDADSFRARWDTIQTGFVDEPRRAVEQADALVAELMKRLAEVFSNERGQLEDKWGHDRDVSTEDLRLALQRYRSFFGRLLSV